MPIQETQNSSDGFLRVFTVDDFRQSMRSRLRHVGVPDMHAQHEGLVEIMVSLYSEVKKLQKGVPGQEEHDSLRATINELKRYATKHFQEEEAFMRRIAFPGLEPQIAAHQAFVKSLLEVEKRMWEESISYVIDLQHLVVGWLFEHINLMDMAYGRFSRGEKESVGPLTKTLQASSSASLPQQREKTKSPDTKSQADFRNSLRSRLRMTGIPRIDKEHQQLLEQVIDLNILAEGLSTRKPSLKDWQQIDQAIHFLTTYCRDHFTGEEAWMRSVGYPKLAVHTEEHKRLLIRLQDLAAKLSKDHQVLYVVDLNFFLVEWLLTHTSRTDFLYVEFGKVRSNP
ncbi:MAG: hemerythrin family protein [Magnetococcales bacterium]|nr:hemerythrin family protein [Magnetococcales bacterium]MBF0322596.1 hemerythrin family protein [Magnetococcales bacterium]